MGYITFHIQKDRRIKLGYVVHQFRDCQALMGKLATSVVEIAGPIVHKIPKCQWCAKRSEGVESGGLG